MRALLSETPGGPDTLVVRDIDPPVAGPGQLLIDVKACAINFPDVLIIEDKYQLKPPRPFAPGSEIAGVVSALGEGVSGFAVGDRVIAATGFGGLVEQAAVASPSVYPLPDAFPFEQGAALLMTYGTAIHALLDRGRMAGGETVLVLGAAGGVGIAAIELAKAFGGRVVAGVSSEAKGAMAREAGADDVVVYPRAPFDKDASKALAGTFKEALGPNGADIVFDIVGGDYCEPALRSMAWQGRYLVVGFPAGIPAPPLNLALLKGCDICGVFWGAFAARDPKANATHIATLFDLWADGKISPRVTETYALEQGGEAIAKLASRAAVGKLVVTI
ncbi:MAG: NADPH:quinone oxidoreductase family protein [Sphingomonadales bacterium]|nr:NADPH:quinone oxidoreductase family protein [Sphingomonadales bacterium]